MSTHQHRRALTLALLLLAASSLRGQQADPASSLVARAGRYVREYEQRFSGIVGEEHQTQRLVKPKGDTATQRTLVSDVLFVKAGDRTLVFRDVIAADGKPVRDREERLQKLFLGGSRDAVKQAQAIVAESARFDLDFPRFRTLNGLLLPLAIVKPEMSERFRFAASTEGLTFEESRSPTLLRYRRNSAVRDMPLRGGLTIDAASGRLRAASLVAGNADIEGSVEVRYSEDAKVDIFVPTQMRETYRRPAKPKDDHLEVVSDYSNFRRFDVTVEMSVDLPE
jgi:hypothetical protein